MKRHVALYIVYILLLFASIIVAVTGIIKFPGLLAYLKIDQKAIPLGLFTWLHDWLGLLIVIMTVIHLILNWGWIKGMTRKLLPGRKLDIFSLIIVIGSLSLVILYMVLQPRPVQVVQDSSVLDEKIITTETPTPEIPAPGENTLPSGQGQISIEDVGEFTFNAEDVTTTRPDIFKPGYFTIFDILVYLDTSGQIELDYYFSEEHGTHVINSINGIEQWWYISFYDGGWPERNVWPMDLHPYKDKMTIKIIQITRQELAGKYDAFAIQKNRSGLENGTVTIPEVLIAGPTELLTFENVEVRAHDLRNDSFVDGTITAIDAILSMGEQGLLTYELNWYESIGSAGVVKNYFVDAINGHKSANRCGFVYEIGEKDFYGAGGNHIHIPADQRVINSIPEYIEFFWICI